MTHAETIHEWASGPRGVLASYVSMMARAVDDAARFKVSVRDVVLILCGSLAMYGAQVGVQWGMRSDIRSLGDKFDAYVSKQDVTTSTLQRQIDELRKESALNRVNQESQTKETAELKGILMGAGIKGVPK